MIHSGRECPRVGIVIQDHFISIGISMEKVNGEVRDGNSAPGGREHRTSNQAILQFGVSFVQIEQTAWLFYLLTQLKCL